QGMFKALSHVAAQSPDDAKRFTDLGLPLDKLSVTGNLKFDMPVPDDLIQRGIALREELGLDRFIWIAASTHTGEEEIILKAHRKIVEKFPTALLVLVPRHPDRFSSVGDLIASSGFSYIKRSAKEKVSSEVQVYLGDTMG